MDTAQTSRHRGVSQTFAVLALAVVISASCMITLAREGF